VVFKFIDIDGMYCLSPADEVPPLADAIFQ
jgi:hypothetical protein